MIIVSLDLELYVLHVLRGVREEGGGGSGVYGMVSSILDEGRKEGRKGGMRRSRGMFDIGVFVWVDFR